MSIKKALLFNLMLIVPIFSFAGISIQDKADFKKTYGSEIKLETYTNIYNSCDASGTDIQSCFSKFKAKPSAQKSISNSVSKYCCLNVSGFVGEYAYIRGQDYCIPPC